MATLNISNAPYAVTGKKVTIYYTTDVTLTNIQLTKDGKNYIDAISFSQTSAIFDISSWSNGTYSSCVLKGTYENTSGGSSTVYGQITINKTSLSVNANGTGTFTVKLSQAPTNNQTVSLSRSNSNITIDKTSLTFTPSNYNTTQTVTVTGVTAGTSSVITLSSSNVSSKTINVTINASSSSGGGSDSPTLSQSSGGFSTSGTIDSNSSYTHIDTYLSFADNTGKTISWGIGGWTRYLYYDSNKNLLGYGGSDREVTSATVSTIKSLAPSGAVYFRMSINKTVTFTLS